MYNQLTVIKPGTRSQLKSRNRLKNFKKGKKNTCCKLQHCLRLSNTCTIVVNKCNESDKEEFPFTWPSLAVRKSHNVFQDQQRVFMFPTDRLSSFENIFDED